MAKQNTYRAVFLASSVLGIISMILIFFDQIRNTGIALLILATVLTLTGLLAGARMTMASTYLMTGTLLGLVIAIFHLLIRKTDTAILFMIVVFSIGFILTVVPGKKRSAKPEEIRKIIGKRAEKEEELPTIQVVNAETDKIYKELEKIEEELKKLEKEEKKKATAKERKTKKKKAKKKTAAKKRKTKKKASQ
jgi:ABC-type multidrug transport system fused ATPase/permease subunit